MTIIVENGTGVDNANSYVTVSGVGVYASTYGYSEWEDSTVTDTIKEQSLLKAMRYIDGMDWRGQRVVAEQDLSFPRANLYDESGREVANNIVPKRVIEAVCEACILSLPNSEVELEQIITKDDWATAEQITGAVSSAYLVSERSIRTISTVIEAKLRGYLKNKLIVEIVRA